MKEAKFLTGGDAVNFLNWNKSSDRFFNSSSLIEKVGQDMCIGPHDLIGIIKVNQHAYELFFTIALDDGLFFLFGLQIHTHAWRIGFGMKLRSDHIFIKADAHDGSFVWHVWPAFFYAKDPRAHFI
jgi:hypothetical protein